jgi:hypothetical protein
VQHCPSCDKYTTGIDADFSLVGESKVLWKVEAERRCECGYKVTFEEDIDVTSPVAPKVIIAGTGRTGTTFLMRLLTALGLDTGWPSETAWMPRPPGVEPGRTSGFELGILEHPIYQYLSPVIMKGPVWSTALRTSLSLGFMVKPQHILIPFRDLQSAAESRLNADLLWGNPEHVKTVADQKSVLAHVFGEIIATAIEYDVPYTIMRYPEFIQDPEVCREQLTRALPQVEEIDEGVFTETQRQIADLSKVKYKQEAA